MNSDEEYQNARGQVRPIIHANHNGMKVVAVGSQLHFVKPNSTFPDFLYGYMMDLLREDGAWGGAELKKPVSERHQLMQWHQSLCETQRQYAKDSDGILRVLATGYMAAYTTMAYDLYVLGHHSSLQNEVLRRLKINDQFQGAKYELFVAATMIRAGFDIRYEDETDRSTTHPEFVATHRLTGVELDVEAKSKHRHGVLGYVGKETVGTGIDMSQLFKKGVRKFRGKPLVVFLDLNLPRPKTPLELEAINNQTQNVCANAKQLEQNGKTLANLVVFTNFPYHYLGSSAYMPSEHWSFFPSLYPVCQLPNPDLLNEIMRSVSQAGIVPNEFPKQAQLIPA